MKNITLSASEELIEQARTKARHHNTTLNAEFRLWLETYTRSSTAIDRKLHDYIELMKELRDVDAGSQPVSRDEMNER
jgi:hypothetical protein